MFGRRGACRDATVRCEQCSARLNRDYELISEELDLSALPEIEESDMLEHMLQAKSEGVTALFELPGVVLWFNGHDPGGHCVPPCPHPLHASDGLRVKSTALPRAKVLDERRRAKVAKTKPSSRTKPSWCRVGAPRLHHAARLPAWTHGAGSPSRCARNNLAIQT
jgi:hypothetical protein